MCVWKRVKGGSKEFLEVAVLCVCVWKRVKGGSKGSLEVAMLYVCVEEG